MAQSIDPYKRYQKGLCVQDIYPLQTERICACGCDQPLTGRRRRWASEKCKEKAVRRFLIIKGDTAMIRAALRERDNGVCARCEVKCRFDNEYEWQADHVVEVRHGGGGCNLDGYQTLCVDCHKVKTKGNY